MIDDEIRERLRAVSGHPRGTRRSLEFAIRDFGTSLERVAIEEAGVGEVHIYLTTSDRDPGFPAAMWEVIRDEVSAGVLVRLWVDRQLFDPNPPQPVVAVPSTIPRWRRALSNWLLDLSEWIVS